jgi:thymidylate synthase
MAPFPVTTEYAHPEQRVVFWPQRDANPFFHLYEALWMLAGRNDLAPLMRYAKQMADYSDDGVFIRGSAYGHRWRTMFGMNQLEMIADELKKNPDSRRCVLQMWSTERDLGVISKDLPCNLTATFQINHRGELELCVFCRSNDIIWGAYGANAVHFSMLQEYMATWLGVPMGPYRQISINWHAYVDKLDALKDLPRQSFEDPYMSGEVHHVPMPKLPIEELDARIAHILRAADTSFAYEPFAIEPWTQMITHVLYAHQIYFKGTLRTKYTDPLEVLNRVDDQQADWVVAARQWLQRRLDAFDLRNM